MSYQVLARKWRPKAFDQLVGQPHVVTALANALDTGHDVGAPLPLTAAVMEMMQWLKTNGYEGEDHSALVRYYEYLSRADVRR